MLNTLRDERTFVIFVQSAKYFSGSDLCCFSSSRQPLARKVWKASSVCLTLSWACEILFGTFSDISLADPEFFLEEFFGVLYIQVYRLLITNNGHHKYVHKAITQCDMNLGIGSSPHSLMVFWLFCLWHYDHIPLDSSDALLGFLMADSGGSVLALK